MAAHGTRIDRPKALAGEPGDVFARSAGRWGGKE